MSTGGRSTFFVQSLGSRHFGTRLTVGVSREATLSEDLSSIESRGLRGIRLVIGDEGSTVTLSREATAWLRDRLTEALDATTEFADARRIEAAS